MEEICTCCGKGLSVCDRKISYYPEDHKFRIGGHVSVDLTRPIIYSLFGTSDLETCQIFLGDPDGYKCNEISNKEKDLIKSYCKDNYKTFYVHVPFKVNMAATNPNVFGISKKCLKQHLKQVADLPAACVLHTGAVGTIIKLTERLNELEIPSVDTPSHCSLLLENSAGEGTKLGKNFDQMRKIFEGLDSSKIGMCIDTQHLFASGECTFENHESVVKMFDEIENVGRLGLIHLNDSVCSCGSKKDCHENIGDGCIWKRNNESLLSLLQIAKEKEIDMVMETSSWVSDIDELRILSKDL